MQMNEQVLASMIDVLHVFVNTMVIESTIFPQETVVCSICGHDFQCRWSSKKRPTTQKLSFWLRRKIKIEFGRMVT